MRKKRRDLIFRADTLIHHHQQKYVVARVLGAGAMGQVFLVTNSNTGNLSVVKVLHPDLADDESYVKRFEYEARVIGRLKHRGIVSIIQQDRLTDPVGLPFLQMEYAEGETLRDALKRRKTFSVETTLVILYQILSALDHIHQAGIIHRDMKPDNVMLIESSGGLPQTKIFDFGIFKHVELDMGCPRFCGQGHYARFFVDCNINSYSMGLI